MHIERLKKKKDEFTIQNNDYHFFLPYWFVRGNTNNNNSNNNDDNNNNNNDNDNEWPNLNWLKGAKLSLINFWAMNVTTVYTLYK